MATSPTPRPTGDLPAREQLELFPESGQGAARMAKKSSSKGGEGSPGGGGGGAAPGDVDASLETEARRRYLNYALSVITSRALPDAWRS